MSGEQRLKSARENARDNQASLQRDLDARRKGPAAGGKAGASGASQSVRVKQEPLSDSEEPMDTSDAATSGSGSAIPNGSVNGYPGSPDPQNGHAATGPELQDFVRSTFRRHFVLTLSEVKRLLNLHLAALPPGRCPLGAVSDRALQDAILLNQCKQILVPVSMPPPPLGAQGRGWGQGTKYIILFSILYYCIC